MRRVLLSAALVLATGLTVGLMGPTALAASAGRADPQPGMIVDQVPVTTTPNILDGTVYSLTAVGTQIVVGGSFTQVQDAGSSTTLERSHLFAFDATTGKVSTTFAPQPSGTVFKVQAAADGTSVYVGGLFTRAGGLAHKNLFKADVSTGAVATGFAPANLDGQVRDLEVVGGRLWIAGRFRHIGVRTQRGLGTLNATTGLYDPYFTGVLAGVHNPGKAGSVTSVEQISTNPANTALVAVGNFMTVNTRKRPQIVKIDLPATAYDLSTWSTSLFAQACSAAFMTNMTDVEYAPNGSYFAVSTTGAYGGAASLTGTSGCDVVARFESNSTTLAAATWTAYTGGDSTWTIEVTDKVVYAGGHQRWQNNPTARDAAGQGAVERTGIAALDPVNGMPYSWNPTRTRGVGVQDLLATDRGLYVGSDTTVLADRYRARIAMLPLSTGKTLPTVTPYTLPSDVYTVATSGSQLVRRAFDGTGVTATSDVTAAGPAWATTVGAFAVNGTLYTADADGTMRKQTFDGTGYGPATPVATADELVAQTDWHGADVPTLTSLFYSNGRIYFTRTGENVLYNRAFEVEDDVVGQQRFSTTAPTGISYATMHGAFVASGRIYFANSSGQLFRATWTGSAPAASTATQVSGPGKDLLNWSSRAMFVR